MIVKQLEVRYISPGERDELHGGDRQGFVSPLRKDTPEHWKHISARLSS